MQKLSSTPLAALRGRVADLSSTVSRIGIAVVICSVIAGGGLVRQVSADAFDDKIRALQNQNDSAQSNVNELIAQAASYADTIAILQTQINAVQSQINLNQAEQARIVAEIAAKQAELDRQRALLGAVVQTMYVDGEISTIEMLATSDNLSDFIDKEEYRNTVQESIQESLGKIAKLQSDLKVQQAQVEQLIVDQTAQRAQLSADRAQHDQMLAYTQAQKEQFNAQIASNSSKIADLRKQQIAANARFAGTGAPGSGPACGGGYPGSSPGPWGAWGCNYAMDNAIDNWGMYNRQCVSYTAFRAHQDYLNGQNSRDMPYWGGVGNANQWDDNARRAGIPVDSNPERGAIAVSNSGYYGHVMYVEGVNGDGTINISQYNASWDGRYSERYNLSPAGLVFIHF